ncbi:MAG TPA: glycosyltransferase family 1 protein [Candidatus Acidoferrales bacterium]|nr:glycosyltransferase family 1 protein [Candidatus Acidoferrales bacterium]
MGVLLDARALQGPDAQRGIGTYVRGLLRGLLDEGFDRELGLLLDSGLPAPRLPGGDYRVYGTRRRYRGRLALYEDAVALGADLGRIRPRLFHATTLSQPGRAPCRVVVTLHDLIPWALGGRSLRGERLRYWLGRRLLRRAELVLAVSECTARDARRLAGLDGDRVRVIPEGLDPAFQPRPGAAARVEERFGVSGSYFLFVGALDVRKDPRGLLRAWRAARAAGADGRLVLAGQPGAQAPAEMPGALAVGFVGGDELADLFSAAVCLLHPSRYEGFGLTVLEAMGCGCPAVAYANSSLPEVAGDAAWLIPDGDAEALGRAAATLLRDPERRARLRAAGLTRAAGYSWGRTARQTISAYETLLR